MTAAGSPTVSDILKSGPGGGDLHIVDFHTHVGRWCQHWASEDRPEHLIRSMDEFGVKKSVVHHLMGLASGDVRRGNDVIGRAMREYPGRLEGAIEVNPNYRDATIPELERCRGEYDMRAIKLYPHRHGFHLNDRAYWPVYEFASRHGFVVVTHSGARAAIGTPVELSEAAMQFPDVTFVAYHAGPDLEGARIYGECARVSSNFYIEICAPMTHNLIEHLVREAGEDRVLFGSDSLLLSLSAAIGRIASCRLSDDQKRKVLGLNGRRILDKLRNGDG